MIFELSSKFNFWAKNMTFDTVCWVACMGISSCSLISLLVRQGAKFKTTLKMATNFQLLSSSASSMSSDSEDQDHEQKKDTKLDLSYHELDDSSLSINLTEFSGGHYQESQSRVEKLLLYNNILEGIPTAVTDLTKLTLLDISNNLLRTIPQAITNLVNLTHLYLRNNEIGDEDLPKDLRNMLRLRDLNLSGNRLRTIPQSLFHLEGMFTQ